MEEREARELAALARRAHLERYEPDAGSVRELTNRSSDLARAIGILMAADDHQSLIELVGSLSFFWQEWGEVEAGRSLTRMVLDRAGAIADEPSWGRPHLVAGELAFRQGDQADASTETSIALRSAQSLGDTTLEAEAETNLARIAFRDGNAEEIFRHARRIEHLAAGNARLRTKAIHMLGWAEYTAGNLSGAMERFEANAMLYAEMGDRESEASEWANLGDLALEAGDVDAARRHLLSAMRTEGVADSKYLAPSLVRSAAVLLGALGRDEQAMVLMGAAEEAYRQSGLAPDPGDDSIAAIEGSVRSRLGDRAASMREEGEAMGVAAAFKAALAAIAES
jgi:tetratricopeptide (TPR) repeat protein